MAFSSQQWRGVVHPPAQGAVDLGFAECGAASSTSTGRRSTGDPQELGGFCWGQLIPRNPRFGWFVWGDISGLSSDVLPADCEGKKKADWFSNCEHPKLTSGVTGQRLVYVLPAASSNSCSATWSTLVSWHIVKVPTNKTHVRDMEIPSVASHVKSKRDPSWNDKFLPVVKPLVNFWFTRVFFYPVVTIRSDPERWVSYQNIFPTWKMGSSLELLRQVSQANDSHHMIIQWWFIWW